MSKQDLNAVRAAQDLERKYDLSSIAGLKKNYEIQKNNLTKVENELTNFAKATTKNLEDIQNQVDGNITTWFSSGIPTLENYPANEWTTDDDKSNHLGDLYYDQDTGYAYRFALENETYLWLKITDNDVTEALALANSAKDTADRKRQVFVVQPIPPYDVGDLWIKDEEIYRCQTSRPDGEIFEDNDWIKATKYTDDTVANQVDGKLTILSGTVTEIRQDVDELTTKMTNTTKLVDEHGNTIGTLQEKQSETTQTVNEISTKVSTVENSLATTNSNLSDLSDIVNANANDIGTIKTNVSELQQTDEQIKASVESIDKQIIPTNTATGTNIYIEDASDAPLIQLEIEGKSKQETRSGKNLIKLVNEERTINGITFTPNEDGSVTINGTSTAAVYHNLSLSYLDNTDLNTYFTLESGEAYTSYLKKSLDNAVVRMITRTQSQNVALLSVTAGNIIASQTYSGDTDDKAYAYLGIQSGQTFDNVTVYPMIVKGSYTIDTIGEFEKYGAMPSPDYPSEIESVGYENMFDVSKTNQNIAIMSTDGSTATSNYSHTSDYIEIKANKPCVLSFNYDSLSNEASRAICYYDKNKTFLSGDAYYPTNKKATITPTTDGYIRFSYDMNCYDIQVTEGEHNYIPYGKYGIEVETVGKNKLKGLSTPLTNADYWYVVDTTSAFTPLEDGWGRFSYDNTNGTSTVFINAKVNLNAVNLKPNKEYTFVTEIRNSNISESSGAFFQIVTNNLATAFQTGRSLGYSNINQGGIFKATSITKENFEGVTVSIDTYLRLAAGTKGTVEARISLFEDDVDITNFVYEEYKSNILSFELDEPLRSLPNGVRDIARVQNGVLYVERKVGSLVLDGVTAAVTNANLHSGTSYITVNHTNKSIKTIATQDTISVFSNKLIGTSMRETWNGGILNSISQASNGYYLQLCLSQSIGTTGTEINAWLTTNNIQVDYELAEPYTEELGEIEMPSTFQGVTHISTTDDLEPTINIEYVRDTVLSNYVEGQIEKVMTIEERHYSGLVIENDNIKASVTEINSNLSDMTEDIHTVQETLTSTEKTIDIISTNIDKTTGEIREVTTTSGYTFNADGLDIHKSDKPFHAKHQYDGTYYYDKDTIVSETTVDGFMAVKIKNKGSQEYCYDETNKVYEFVKERIEVDGEYGYATFYNGVN